MNRKTILFTITLIAMMLLAGAVTLPTVGGSADAGGSRESRATAIDGEYEDDFDNTDNLTLTGDVNLVDGKLLVDRTVIRDEFDRFPLAPWQASRPHRRGTRRWQRSGHHPRGTRYPMGSPRSGSTRAFPRGT